MRRALERWLIGWTCGLVLLGCATVERDAATPAAELLRDGATLEPAGAAAVEACLGRPLVFVAERHADPGFQAVQREVLEAIAERGRPVALGIEWLPARAQAALDAWLASSEPIAALGAAVAWAEVWGHDLLAYAPILLWARRHGAPVRALNAPPGLARAVARDAIDDLPPDDRAALPPLDTGDDAHFARFAEMMRAASGHGAHGGHTLDEATLRRYYRAQLVWDESMSRNAAAWLATEAGAERALVVLAGSGHVDFAVGVPARLAALTSLPFCVVRPFAPGDLDALGPPLPAGATYPERRADLLWPTP